MTRARVFLRVTRNLSIAAIHSACVYLLFASLHALYSLFERQETELVKDVYPDGPPFSMVELSQWFLVISEMLLIVFVFFWTFVVCNKLWPLRREAKPKSE